MIVKPIEVLCSVIKVISCYCDIIKLTDLSYVLTEADMATRIPPLPVRGKSLAFINELHLTQILTICVIPGVTEIFAEV